jgi:hypothetical protein
MLDKPGAGCPGCWINQVLDVLDACISLKTIVKGEGAGYLRCG